MSKKKKEVAKAPFTGNIQIGERTIDCAVLEDGTRILSERSVTAALGGKRGGSHWRRKGKNGGAELPVYLSSGNLNDFIDSGLAAALSAPVLYTPPHGGGPAHGVKAELLPQICDVFLRARDAGALHQSQEHLAAEADILMRGLAHIGIIALVDEATGYQSVRARKALEEILDTFIAKELRAWAKTFPDVFYEEIFRLRGWPYKPWSVKRPSVVGKYTNDLVYERIAPGLLEELRRKNPPIRTGKRRHKHHQWLTEDVGHPKLREHLAAIIALMRASPNWSLFQRNVRRAFPKYGETRELLLDDSGSIMENSGD